jgi:hypothetical protein
MNLSHTFHLDLRERAVRVTHLFSSGTLTVSHIVRVPTRLLASFCWSLLHPFWFLAVSAFRLGADGRALLMRGHSCLCTGMYGIGRWLGPLTQDRWRFLVQPMTRCLWSPPPVLVLDVDPASVRWQLIASPILLCKPLRCC